MPRRAALAVVASSLAALAATATGASASRALEAAPTPSPRERISINAGWRFQKGDPPGNGWRSAWTNPPSSSRWYPGGGLYRNVWLTKTRPLHVGHWGTTLTTREVSGASATDRIRTPPQYPAFREKFKDKLILSSETASVLSSRGVYLFPVSSETASVLSSRGVYLLPVSSETASVLSSRGVYLFPVSREQSAPVRDGRGGDSKVRQVSAYELHAVDFGSSADKVFGSLARHPYVAGEFVWTGWDYLGEPTPYYASRSSYSGIIDLAGFKKDRFYLYQAHWRPEHPMAHILPHWTWPERKGQVTPVHVFTSGDEAELFLDGQSLGRREKGPFEYRLRWDEVVYEPGTLEVVAYRDGRKWATDRVRTAGPAARLEALPDRATILADGRDLSFVTVRVVDEDGVVVPRADPRIRFEVLGPGEIVATDNGDPTSFEPFPSPERNAFGGLCLVIVRAKAGEPGRIRLTASSEGLRAAGTEITTAAGPP